MSELSQSLGQLTEPQRFNDYRLTNERSLVGITPISDECRSWIDEIVRFEDWQWLGPTLWVDHRCAPTLLSALYDNGFVGEGC